MNSQIFDTDVLDYFPIKDGLKPSSIGLKRLPKIKDQDPKNYIFQIDSFFSKYRANKITCRRERLCKYYQKKEDPAQEVVEFLVNTLVEEYPQHFTLKHQANKFYLECILTSETLVFNHQFQLLESECQYKRELMMTPYLDSWDAIAMQVPEDLILQKVPEDKDDYTQTIHLCHANGWSAEGAVGKTFDYIHHEVPNINKIIPDSRKILAAILNSDQSMERVGALQYRTSGELNRHPEISRKDLNQDFDLETNPNAFLRFERQTVTSFIKSRCFLFTVRTYLTHMKQIGVKDWKWEAFKKTLQEERPDVKTFQFVERYRNQLLAWVDVVDKEHLQLNSSKTNS